MQILNNIITGRATLIAFVVALLAIFTAFGVHMPSNLPDLLSKALDTGLIFAGTLVGAVHLENRTPPAGKP